jgi:hypothetical protein
VIKEPKKLKNNMGIIKEDAFEDVAGENLKLIKKLINPSNQGNVKYLLKGKDLNSLSAKNDFVLINKIYNIIKPKQNNLKERIDNILNEILTEKLCPKGEAYRQRRLAAGEKSSAYLSGRGIKVCKGLMSGKKKKKKK